MKQPETGHLRIIGGAWRSRRIDFVAGEGVRPTPDRVRQTLFDWLAPRIEGARCLDLFAGSGALGLEALSRGARCACFVERGRAQALSIRAALSTLGAQDRAQVVEMDALSWLRQQAARATTDEDKFEIMFLDPPYASDLLTQALPVLPALLLAENRVYVEWPGDQRPTLPAGYQWLREKKAGQVSFGLITWLTTTGQGECP